MNVDVYGRLHSGEATDVKENSAECSEYNWIKQKMQQKLENPVEVIENHAALRNYPKEIKSNFAAVGIIQPENR